MKNCNTIFELLVKNKTMNLNTDLLETGLFNNLILIIILIVFGKHFLSSILKERKVRIIKNLQDSENRLVESKKRLNEAKKRLKQISIILNETKNEVIITKKRLLKSEIHETKKNLKVYFDRSLNTFKSEEIQIFLDVKQQILVLVMQQTIKKTTDIFNQKRKAAELINKIIFKLDKGLL